MTDGDTVKAAKVTPTSDASSSKALSKDKDGTPIRLGDYVMFFGKDNEKLRGIVRWIGTNKSVQPDGTPVVGIEAVSYNQIMCYACMIQSFCWSEIFVFSKYSLLLESFAICVVLCTYVYVCCLNKINVHMYNKMLWHN